MLVPAKLPFPNWAILEFEVTILKLPVIVTNPVKVGVVTVGEVISPLIVDGLRIADCERVPEIIVGEVIVLPLIVAVLIVGVFMIIEVALPLFIVGEVNVAPERVGEMITILVVDVAFGVVDVPVRLPQSVCGPNTPLHCAQAADGANRRARDRRSFFIGLSIHPRRQELVRSYRSWR